MTKSFWRGFLRSEGKEASKHQLRLQVEALEDRSLMATGIASSQFDFGKTSAAFAPRTIAVSNAPYSPILGYGWATPFKATARATSGPRQRDANPGSENDFRVDLPNGLYQVSVTVRDPRVRNQLSIWAEGRLMTTGQPATSRPLAPPSFQVAVTDGQLNLRFTSAGKTPLNVKPNALKIEPVLFASAGPNLVANEGDILTFSGSALGRSNLTYAWDFGDGDRASGSLTPEHVYRDNKPYTATLSVTDGSGATVQLFTTVAVANVAPTAAVSGPYTATAGQTLTLQGSATDPSTVDTAAGFTYTWNFGDGTAPVSGKGLSSPSHIYTTPGTYTVLVTATDKDNATSPAVATTVTVANVAPTASVSGPYTAIAGQALTLGGSVTNPSTVDTAAGFTYTWNFGDSSPQVSGKGLSSPSHVYASAGTYNVLVAATDKNGATGPAASTTVTVTKPTGPILAATAGGPYTGFEGVPTSLKATAGGGNRTYTYAWDLDNNGSFETVGQTVAATFPDNGTYTVKLRVADSAGQSVVVSTTVAVANVAPTAAVSGPYTATAGQTLTLGGSATDPSTVDTAAGFTYTWNFGDGTAPVSGKGLSSPSHIYTTPGTYTVLVTATDKDNATSPAVATTVTVAKPPDPPLIASAGGPYTGFEGASTSFTATAGGGNGSYTYAWDLDNNGSFETVGQTVVSTFADNGTYTVKLRVSDSAGQSAVASATITVANVAPTASVSGPYTVVAGQTLTLGGSATDPSTVDTAAGFTYTWNFGDGTAPVSGKGLSSPSHIYTTPGTYTVLVTATDKDNATSPAVATTVTVAKPPDPPLIASAGGPYTGFEGASTSFTATAGGGNGSYTYAWDLDNNGSFETVGQTVVSTFADNGTYTVKLRVSDSAGQSAVASATITVANVAPTASVSGPYTVVAGQTLTLGGSATDPSTVDTAAGFTYTWNFGDGTAPVSGKGLSSPSHIYTTPGTYTVLVTATDKDNATSPAVATTVTVAKPPDPPLIASAGGPYTGFEGASTSFTATAGGGNGSYTYAWDLDNNGSFETVGQTVVSTFADNGSYTVQLRVTDSAGQSAVASATVTIANVAPTVFGSGSYSALPGQTLTFQASATDPSPVDTAAGFIYTWNFGDGSAPLSGLGLTNPSHVYAAAGEYTATVTATDKEGAVSPVVFTTVTILSLIPASGLATTVLTAGWASFGQVVPQGAARDALQIGNLVTQTDVKTTWPDGSIRYAIVSASVPATGSYPINQAAPSTGTFIPKIPNASVKFTIGGVIYTAALPATKSSDLWLDGPLVTEWRTTVAPVDPSGNPHPFLRVIFDTRAYRDGQDRLDVTVENDLDVAGATKVNYDVNITAGGQTLFSQTGVTQYYLTRWRKVFDLGLTESQVTHDFEPFYQAGALPRFQDTVTDETYSTTGATFDILGRGGNTYDVMGNTGGRPEIAPYPDWTARYLVHQSPSQVDYVMANGDLAGSWPVHIRNVDGTLVSIDSKPNFWLDYRGQSISPASDRPQGDLSGDSIGPLRPDLAHVPSLAYVPYLATGDRYYADELAFWGNDSLISSWSAPIAEGGRGGSFGLVGTEQTRARAWGLRNLTDAAAYMPDKDPTKAYFAQKVANNLSWLDTNARANAGPLGVAWLSTRNTDPTLSIALWEHDYLAWAIDHAHDQGFSGGDVMRDQIVKFQLDLFNVPGSIPELAGVYVLAIGDRSATGVVTYYSTLTQVAKNTIHEGDPKPAFVGYYGKNVRLMLLIAIRNGLVGAQDAYNYLMPSIAMELTDTAGWAIDRRR
ncbi:PKD repeat-containing protein [Singulisphaera sp. GP187]|uniref:PKD domain-containing protein n=1 Tax=Singulisphaera sp. GP187 TaxID=1882752 RepID=UPI000928AC3F|nr:PKD domain-containing protein [Singulisphaera sp. GP187]SIO55084.1 PKD repeat-containing protein [Singulisphaera sp. GP187]